VLRIGRYEIATALDATFALDGGAMFGIVPRPLWEREIAPDARNRIPLAARCLVAVDRAARRVVLVDDGIGERWDAKRTDIFCIQRPEGGLGGALARLGIAATDVTDVLLTHLHFDHAGGTTRRGPDGRLALAFPKATYHIQRQAWQWAHAPTERDRGSFRDEDFELLQHSNQLHLVEGEVDLFPDVELIVCEGHTAGQQLPCFRGEGTQLIFGGDVIPTHAHLRTSWIMGYDLQPLISIEEKKVLLAEALEEDGILVFEHDPAMPACRLAERDGEVVVREPVQL
jgi:glyoxylase-like metal-dependent hydrolase (beta-lactamase superfamily II)